MKRVLILLALCSLSGALPAAATAGQNQRWTMKEAITTALSQNNLIKAAGFTAEGANQGIAIARSRYYPGIFFEETFAASNAPTQTFMMKLDQGRFSQNDFLISKLNHPSSHYDFKTAVTVQQPLYDPSTGPVREMADRDAHKGSLGLEAVREDVAFQVFRLYLEVQKATAHRTSSEQALIDARENMRLAKVRSEAGIGLISDELRARTHLATVEQQNITASNNLVLAQLQLANTVGLAEGSQAEIADASTTLAVSISQEDLAGIAQMNRNDLQQSRTDVALAEAAIKLAGSAYQPAVSAFATYQMNAKDAPLGNDNDAWIAGVTLKWQLFDGFKRCHERDRATAGNSAAREILASRIRESNYQVMESSLRHNETGKRLEVARHALADAEETVRLLKKRFENSLSTMLELLDAQTALNQVRANLVDTQANYALAGGRVFYSAGIFLKEIMK